MIDCVTGMLGLAARFHIFSTGVVPYIMLYCYKINAFAKQKNVNTLFNIESIVEINRVCLCNRNKLLAHISHFIKDLFILSVKHVCLSRVLIKILN